MYIIIWPNFPAFRIDDVFLCSRANARKRERHNSNFPDEYCFLRLSNAKYVRAITGKMLNGWRPFLLLVASVLQLSPRCGNLVLPLFVVSRKQKEDRDQQIRQPETSTKPSNHIRGRRSSGVVKYGCRTDVSVTERVERVANLLTTEFRQSMRKNLEKTRTYVRDKDPESTDRRWQTVDSQMFLLHWKMQGDNSFGIEFPTLHARRNSEHENFGNELKSNISDITREAVNTVGPVFPEVLQAHYNVQNASVVTMKDEEREDDGGILWIVFMGLLAIFVLILALMVIWVWIKRRRATTRTDYGDLVEWQSEKENILDASQSSKRLLEDDADNELNNEYQMLVAQKNELLRGKTSPQSKFSKKDVAADRQSNFQPTELPTLLPKSSLTNNASHPRSGKKQDQPSWTSNFRDQATQTSKVNLSDSEETDEDIAWDSHSETRKLFRIGVKSEAERLLGKSGHTV